MRNEQILQELEQAAARLGVKVCYEAIPDVVGQGGLCKVKGEWRVIVDRYASTGDKVSLLAAALERFDLEAVYLSPEVRELVSSTRALHQDRATES
jgi:hypothetical protein